MKTGCVYLQPDPRRESICAVFGGHGEMTQGVSALGIWDTEVGDPRSEADQPQPRFKPSREEFLSLWVLPSNV